jgi:guanylate kinase
MAIRPANPGDLIVVAAPSGAGKTSLVKALVDSEGDMEVSVSHTTRNKRPHEVHGVNYFFVDEPTFVLMEKEHKFIEHARVFGNLYGTSRAEMKRILDQGRHLILEIDWQGAAQIRRTVPDAITIFIMPPSLATLRQRLQTRAADDNKTIELRMANAVSDMKHFSEFDFLIVNDRFDQALLEMKRVIHHRDPSLSTPRQAEKLGDLIRSLTQP